WSALEWVLYCAGTPLTLSRHNYAIQGSPVASCGVDTVGARFRTDQNLRHREMREAGSVAKDRHWRQAEPLLRDQPGQMHMDQADDDRRHPNQGGHRHQF